MVHDDIKKSIIRDINTGVSRENITTKYDITLKELNIFILKVLFFELVYITKIYTIKIISHYRRLDKL